MSLSPGVFNRFLLVLPTAVAIFGQVPSNSPRTFENRCSICHGGDANGSDRAPSILPFFASHSEDEISALIRQGRIEKGMPAFPFDNAEITALIAQVHGLAAGKVQAGQGIASGRSRAGYAPKPGSVKLANGRVLEGTILNENDFSMQLLTADGHFHLLHRSSPEESFVESGIEPKKDWASYDGDASGNRYSALENINTGNVNRLALSWLFPVAEAPRLEVTPIVVDGVMYITGPNEAYALDATSGLPMWHYRQPRTKGLLSEAGAGASRGLAIQGDRLFMETDDAHLIALDRRTGARLWDAKMGDPRDGYSATSAPLVAGDLVIAGVSGGEEGARGFVDAYRAETGEHAWRFYTIPKRGDKEAETWEGTALERGCGATWLTGSYDAALGLVYWAVGNPCPDYNGDQRKGDNLYTSSVVALDAATGGLKWHYQFTPHDLHDWDSAQPLVLTDQNWEGQPRKLLLHADRNGFFFVLDRTDGQLLHSSSFVRVTWATGYGKDGRPVLIPGHEPTLEGTLTCPGYGGSTWMSASFNPVYKLFYVRASGNCGVFKKTLDEIEMGERFYGGVMGRSTEPTLGSSIKALDFSTGKTVWEHRLGAGFDRSGTLSTAGGVVLFGDGAGDLVAVDAANGKTLWHAGVGQVWWASPMTYMVGGKQFVAIAGPAGIFSFAIPD
jgi:alcohol dehydrogenase (cytochrome c)